MRRSHTLIAAAAALVVLACAGSVFAYDASRDDTISNGVKVGVIDVGGLTADAARAKLRAAMLAKLQRPLIVVAGETRFPLSAREARIEADIDEMVVDAVKRGREGSIVTRTWRGLTGGEVDVSVTPQVAYSRPAVQRLVDRVRVKMSRKPVDADIAVAGQKVEVRKSKVGLKLDAKRLRAKVEQALVSDIVGERSVRAELERIQPKITTKRLASKYPVILTVERSNYRINLFKKLKKVKTYGIAVGQAGPRDAGRPVHDHEQGRQPGVARAELAVGRLARRHGHPRRHAEQPTEGPLARRLRRRRRARHRRSLLDRHERVAWLHPDARRGRHQALRPGAGRHPDLHQLTNGLGEGCDGVRPISSTGISSQPRDSSSS